MEMQPRAACPQRLPVLVPTVLGPSAAHADAGILAGACDLRPFLLPAPKDRGAPAQRAGRQGELDARRLGGHSTGLGPGPRAARAQEGLSPHPGRPRRGGAALTLRPQSMGSKKAEEAGLPTRAAF